jgi:hypothetical protein
MPLHKTALATDLIDYLNKKHVSRSNLEHTQAGGSSGVVREGAGRKSGKSDYRTGLRSLAVSVSSNFGLVSFECDRIKARAALFTIFTIGLMELTVFIGN